jgi:hypothetical protein
MDFTTKDRLSCQPIVRKLSGNCHALLPLKPRPRLTAEKLPIGIKSGDEQDHSVAILGATPDLLIDTTLPSRSLIVESVYLIIEETPASILLAGTPFISTTFL